MPAASSSSTSSSAWDGGCPRRWCGRARRPAPAAAALQDGVEVHLLERAALVLDLAARHDLQPDELRLGLGAAVGLDQADDDVDALGLAPARGRQHLVGLADAGRGAEEDLQLAAAFPARAAFSSASGEGRVSVGSPNHRSAPTMSLRLRRASSAMLSCSTLTRGSPSTPRKRPSMCWVDELAHPRLRQAARLGHARHLELGGGRRDVRDRGRSPRSSPGRPARGHWGSRP